MHPSFHAHQQAPTAKLAPSLPSQLPWGCPLTAPLISTGGISSLTALPVDMKGSPLTNPLRTHRGVSPLTAPPASPHPTPRPSCRTSSAWCYGRCSPPVPWQWQSQPRSWSRSWSQSWSRSQSRCRHRPHPFLPPPLPASLSLSLRPPHCAGAGPPPRRVRAWRGAVTDRERAGPIGNGTI